MILVVRVEFNSRCSLTVVIGSCPLKLISSEKTSPQPLTKMFTCAWRKWAPRTKSCWKEHELAFEPGTSNLELKAMSWTRTNLLDIESLSADEIVTVLDTARAFKAVGERAIKKVPALRGKTVVNLFVEPFIRTRISFELSEQRLSADIINFTAEASSLKKGETLKDTARNLEALNADFIVIRHSASGAPHFLARVLNASVINAGDG